MNKILEKIADFAYNCGKDGAQLPSWRGIMSLSFRRSSRKMKKTSKMIVEFPESPNMKVFGDLFFCNQRRLKRKQITEKGKTLP